MWEHIFWDAFSPAAGNWWVQWCLKPGPATPLEECMEGAQPTERRKTRGGIFPWPLWLSLFATWVTVCWSWWDKRDLFLKGLFAKSYNILQVLNPGVTTSKTAHFSERVCDVPVTAWPLWTLLYACCGAQSVPYWKLKWQTGWGKRVFSFSYLVRSVHPTQHMCQQCCHLDLNQLPQVCSAGSKELIT